MSYCASYSNCLSCADSMPTTAITSYSYMRVETNFPCYSLAACGTLSVDDLRVVL